MCSSVLLVVGGEGGMSPPLRTCRRAYSTSNPNPNPNPNPNSNQHLAACVQHV